MILLRWMGQTHPIDRRLGERDKFRVIPGPSRYLLDVEIAERKSNRLVYSRQKQRQTREALWCSKGALMVQGQGIRAIEQSGFLLYESSVHREVRARTRTRMIAGQEPNTQLYFHSSYLFLSLPISLLLCHHWLSNWIRRSRMRGIKSKLPSLASTRVNDDARTLCGGGRRAKLPSAQVTFSRTLRKRKGRKQGNVARFLSTGSFFFFLSI